MYKLGSTILCLYYFISCTDGMKWFSINLDPTCRVEPVDRTKDYHYILLWDSPETYSKNTTIEAYYKNDYSYENESCLHENCLFTHRKDLMPIDKFDAILFNEINLQQIHDDFPLNKSKNRLNIFVQFKPPQNFRVDKKFNDFFNLAITYRLDSDISIPYLKTSFLNGTEVAPSKKIIHWKKKANKLSDQNLFKLYGKHKLVAWFDCETAGRKNQFVQKLTKYLDELGFEREVDRYGPCGLKCLKGLNSECAAVLSKNYMFYLAFEDSLSDDYISDKVMAAFDHDTVPIVFGGADYTRFLPEGSYLDACKLGPKKLAWTIVYLYKNRKVYESFFKWRNIYKIEKTNLQFAPSVCKVLNNRKYKKRIRKNTLHWWNRRTHRVKCDYENDLPLGARKNNSPKKLKINKQKIKTKN